MKRLLSTKEVARLLGINEKLVYSLITEKGLPATKITGKWVFPEHLVEQWIDSKTINYPNPMGKIVFPDNLLVISGSTDILLDRTLDLYLKHHPVHNVAFGNLGSFGGLDALRRGLCQIATSHLPQENGSEFNFSYTAELLEKAPAVVNFCRREQGFLVARGNPHNISTLYDAVDKGLTIVNRHAGTSTRLLQDRELAHHNIDPEQVVGYEREVAGHLEVGLEILAGRADIGAGIRPVATLLELDFLPLAWERFDMIIPQNLFFHSAIQQLLELLQHDDFYCLINHLPGYDLSLSGQLLHPRSD